MPGRVERRSGQQRRSYVTCGKQKDNTINYMITFRVKSQLKMFQVKAEKERDSLELGRSGQSAETRDKRPPANTFFTHRETAEFDGIFPTSCAP